MLNDSRDHFEHVALHSGELVTASKVRCTSHMGPLRLAMGRSEESSRSSSLTPKVSGHLRMRSANLVRTRLVERHT